MTDRGAPAVPVAPPDDPRARAGAPLVSGSARTLSGAPVGSGFDPRTRARAPLLGGARAGATLAERAKRTASTADGPAARDLRAEAPQLEVERISGGAERSAGRRGALRFDGDAVLSGFIWHQVLGAPRARRRVGGGPFPER